MTTTLWRAISLTILFVHLKPIFAASNVVDLGYAKYEGFVTPNDSNTNFLGIRFAASPTGSLRFRAPHPPQYTLGIQKANSFAANCYTGNPGVNPVNPFKTGNFSVSARVLGVKRADDDPGTSEDCLFLNVYIPGKLDPTKRLPVLVWIHGGGYAYGSGAAPGNDLIQFSDGLIYVIIPYRLGVFGFLAGEEVKRGGDLNVGLLDQQYAFQWIREHIHKFGGDPDRVTIWGLSAGAGSVMQHVVANGGNTNPPLFRGVITSSTYLPPQYEFNHYIPEALFTQVANLTGCATAVDKLDCLRSVDADILENANVNISVSAFYGTYLFVPVIDGDFITKRPTEFLKSGRINGDAILSFTNANEGTAFVDPRTSSTVKTADYISQLYPTLNQNQILAASWIYADLGTPFDQVIAIMGESTIVCPTYYLLNAFKGRSFKGEFAIPPGLHADDLNYYFPSLNANGVPPYNNTNFSTAFVDSFLDFAINLNPNSKHNPSDITPFWSTYNGDGGNVEMLFNKTAGSDLPDIHLFGTSATLLKRCEFWESIGEVTGL